MPNTPVKAAGMRSEPAPSVPRCSTPETEQRGHRPAAGRAAGRVVRIPRIAGDAGQRTMADADPAMLGHAGLAENDGALLAQPRDRRRILGAGVAIAGFRAAPGRQPLTQILSLIEAGTPSIGPSGLPARQRASDCGRSRQHALRLDRQEGVERRIAVDAGQAIARDFDRRQFAAPVGGVSSAQVRSAMALIAGPRGPG